MVDAINDFLRSIGTGEWSSSFSIGDMNSIVKLAGIVIVLAVILDVFLRYHRKKGHFTHPDAAPEQRIHDIIHLINSELDELYSHSGLIDSIIEKIGGIKTKDLAKGELNPTDVTFTKGGFFKTTVWRFDLNSPEHVGEGNFGRLSLNKHFLTVRTNQHRYAINIAAQLFLFQIYAIAGKDPRTIQHDNRKIKKWGEIILARTGKLKEAVAMNEGVILSIVKHDRKVDDEIAGILNMTDKESKDIEAALHDNVRSIHDIPKGKLQVVVKEEEKAHTWMLKEIKHLKGLLHIMKKKEEAVKEFLEKQNMEDSARKRLEEFLEQWNKDIAHIHAILVSLEKIESNKDNWSFTLKESHHWQRVKKEDLGSVANRLDQESSKKFTDINKIHAIFSSFTAERGRILQLMRMEEATI